MSSHVYLASEKSLELYLGPRRCNSRNLESNRWSLFVQNIIEFVCSFQWWLVVLSFLSSRPPTSLRARSPARPTPDRVIYCYVYYKQQTRLRTTVVLAKMVGLLALCGLMQSEVQQPFFEVTDTNRHNV